MYEICALFVGIGLRMWLFRMPRVLLWISSRPEIETPLTSWGRLIEGEALMRNSQSYQNKHSYHGSTLLLALISYLNLNAPFLVEILFIASDVISAVALYLFAQKFLRKELKSQKECKEKLFKGVSSILIKPEHVSKVPTIICALYMCNPFSLATCISKSSVTFNNLFLALFLLSAVQGSIWQMAFYVALSTYETLYPVQLLLATGLCAWKYQEKPSTLKICYLKSLACFTFWMALILTLSFLCEPTTSSLLSHYKFILSAPDQTPNVGVFWYFFTEVFDHFHTFFMCVFQINVLIYSIPMSIKLKSHPVFLVFMLIAITGIFKSYPSVGDASLWLCLLPLWSHTFSYLRYPSVTGAMLLTSTILCPVMWHMWINAHSANANFYFAATLAYTTALVLITTDTAMAYLNWHVRIREGLKPCVAGTSEKAVLRLMN
uniref:Phosphatidylinositol glycan anchor biosynthesis class U protein n=1 Tax=Phallusia mammillata TaxID=59560 RepID=A0A6F9DP07_9ASCI|nr:phosphatidylinositol glycan anchor biosynthesis class U protein [Phallusia mammillata]